MALACACQWDFALSACNFHIKGMSSRHGLQPKSISSVAVDYLSHRKLITEEHTGKPVPHAGQSHGLLLWARANLEDGIETTAAEALKVKGHKAEAKLLQLGDQPQSDVGNR